MPARSASTKPRPAAGRSGATGRRPARRPPPRRGVTAVVGGVLHGGWMLLARTAGGSARAIGRQAATARDLDPAHRRDGLGLATFGLGLVLAAGLWGHAAGPAGQVITTGVRWLVGSAGALLPLMALALALRLLRKAPDPDSRGRHIIGWSALFVGVLGLVHVAHGSPTTALGRQRAGGVLGTLAGAPLESALTPWLAAPLLVLVTVFGLLVVTATPVNQVLARLAGARDRLLRRHATAKADGAEPGPAEEDADEPVRRRRPSRRRQG
ncbi:MAG: DNA translocase FtsK 4TM domain-containing protein, partial [Pseudonocardiales bacterium]